MPTKETAFVAFTPEQAAQYASGRSHSYPEPLCQSIHEYHHGPRDLFLDVGTGPGKAVFDLLPYFSRAVGCDASPGMIEQATLGAQKRGIPSDRATFVQCKGEECDAALADAGKADMVTVAMAAHWLDLPAFYASAANALRPGGTLAVWTAASLYCHPSTPNAAAVQATLDGRERYIAEGNLLSREAYENLPLPFQMAGLEGAFDRDAFVRRQWDADGVPSAPDNADGSPGPFLKHAEMRLEDLARGLETSNSVIRWREGNPEKAMTREDVVFSLVERIRQLVGGETVVLSPSFVLLLMRKT